MKLELHFPLTQGEKDFVAFLLEQTTTVEAQGGAGSTIMGGPKAVVAGEAKTKEWPPAEAVPTEVEEEKPAPKKAAKKKAKPKAEAAAEAVETISEAAAEPVEAEGPADTTEFDEAATEAEIDYLQKATDTAVDMIKAKQRDKVLSALEAVGLERVSDAEDQDTAKKLYEALVA